MLSISFTMGFTRYEAFNALLCHVAHRRIEDLRQGTCEVDRITEAIRLSLTLNGTKHLHWWVDKCSDQRERDARRAWATEQINRAFPEEEN